MGHTCNCVKVTNALFLVSCNWQRRTTPHHHNRFTAFFPDHPGEPVPEENFWTLWCKGRLQHTAVMPTPCVTLWFLWRGPSQTGPSRSGLWLISGRAELWLGPGWAGVFQSMHFSTPKVFQRQVSFAFYYDSIGSYFTRLCFKNLLLRLALCLFVFARSVVNTQHSIGCLVVFSWYDVITC